MPLRQYLRVGLAIGAGCTPPAAGPRQAVAPLVGTAACELHGQVTMRDDEPVLRAATGTGRIARFTSMKIALATTAIVPGRAAVVVRAPASGPAMVLRGFVDVDMLDIRAKRDLPVVAPWVVVGSDQPVRAIAAGGSVVRVVPRYGEMRSLSADTTCDGLTLDRGPAPAPPPRGKYMHFARDRVVLFDRAGGAPILEVPLDREGPTVVAVASERGMKRIHYLDGVRVDAWVKSADLDPGEGPDCDDCHGSIEDVMDRCPVPTDDDADCCPEPFDVDHRVRMSSAVRLGPSGDVVGEVEAGVVLAVLDRREGFARVVPAGGEIRGERDIGLWVDASSLERTR